MSVPQGPLDDFGWSDDFLGIYLFDLRVRRAGLRAGDLLLRIDGENTGSRAAARRSIRRVDSEAVAMEIWRRGQISAVRRTGRRMLARFPPR